MCAGPCPGGYYCLEGSTDPSPCPEHTLREYPGARTFNDCLPCPAGYWCKEGRPVPDLCPEGHYCLTGTGPTECPRLHYRDVTGGADIADCFPCQPGYWCNTTGTCKGLATNNSRLINSGIYDKDLSHYVDIHLGVCQVCQTSLSTPAQWDTTARRPVSPPGVQQGP